MIGYPQKIALLYGGRSVEHEISIRSATNLYHHMKTAGYRVILIGISREGAWYLQDVESLDPAGVLPLEVDETKELSLVPGKGIFRKDNPVRLDIDLCFPITHGTNGEDGNLQGLLELLRLPYVGCGPLASAIGMNKHLAKQMAKDLGIPIVPFALLCRDDADFLAGISQNASPQLMHSLAIEAQTIDTSHSRPKSVAARYIKFLQDTLGNSILLKPNNGGSSVGVVALQQYDEEVLIQALRTVGQYGNIILIELLVTDMIEIECAVLKKKDMIEASKPGMIVNPLATKSEFLSYGRKYEAGESRAYLNIPAPVPHDIVKTVRNHAKTLAENYGVSGFARVDFFYRPENHSIFFNEINTLPGMTAESHYPKLIEASGYTWLQLFEILFTDAIEKHTTQNRLSYKREDQS
jgi:D-alanine-D-alanine ligase